MEAVAWISASKVLVYSFWYLLATLAFISCCRVNDKMTPNSPFEGGTGDVFCTLRRLTRHCLQYGRIKYCFLTLLLFVCSFLGKEQAVTFPLWMLLIYWLAGYSFKDRKVWFSVTPFLLLSLVFGIITILSQSISGSAFSGAGYPVWQRMVYACYTFAEYVLKSIVPFKLSYLYPFPSLPGDPLPSWLLIYPLLLAVLLLAFWRQLVTHKVWAFCLLFFGIHIAVALHIVSLSRFTVVADRYAYMATIGVCLLIAYYAVNFVQNSRKIQKAIFISGFAAYLLYFGIYANLRSRDWYDTDTLKKEVLDLRKERENVTTTYNLLRHFHR